MKYNSTNIDRNEFFGGPLNKYFPIFVALFSLAAYIYVLRLARSHYGSVHCFLF